MNMEAKFVYTVCDKGNMVSECLKSIESLRKFVDKDSVIVFYTPPRNKATLAKLSNLARVQEVPNITKPFALAQNLSPSHYGEKAHLCNLDYSTIVFLDGDTIIKKIPSFSGDYDFSARQATFNQDLNPTIWESMFKNVGKKPIPMPNTGFMIFKNYCHRAIREEWLKLINDPCLPNPHPTSNLKEQYALALAISGKRIKWMTAKEHAFKWRGEVGFGSCVVHGRCNAFTRKLKLFAKRLLRGIK